MMGTPSQPIPAATLVVMRERESGAPELLIVERSAAMRFAGGALVFPGGRVDPGDVALAALHDGDGEDLAARIAAIRETIEEAGLAIGVSGLADNEAARTALYGGVPVGEVLAGLDLDLDALVPFARWLPPGDVSHKVFDTRFYLARLPEGAWNVASVDGNENVRLFWATAREVLDMADRGEARIIYPTRRNLERLAQFGSFAEAVADARAHRIEAITPWIETRDGEERLCIPEGLGYPVTSQPVKAASRA
ncbi:NUDIX domain-containing protein [Sphingomonas koreensis]|uniref:NUDIX domain-containing protein n=2 Tax=Sphingomonas koreensis TaxID=93064 RepID=A0A430G1A5_9SPHN|nr:NUDIX domain-containing protein [Sphingomonas koreensis]RSY81466.1 NUDIX domain-containing protein [Sphingomonas koreensis]